MNPLPDDPESTHPSLGWLSRCAIAVGGCWLMALVVLWGAWIFARRGEDAFEQWLAFISSDPRDFEQDSETL